MLFGGPHLNAIFKIFFSPTRTNTFPLEGDITSAESAYLSHRCFANICSQPVACLFIFLTIFSEEQCLILMRSNYLILWCEFFVFYLKIICINPDLKHFTYVFF